MADDDGADLSRNGSTGLFGKLDAELPKQRIAFETLMGLQERASRSGMPLAEYIRLVLDVHVHGADHVARLAADRVRAVVGMGSGQ